MIPIEYFLDSWSWIWVHPALVDLNHYFLFYQVEMFYYFYFVPGYPGAAGRMVLPVLPAPEQRHIPGSPQPAPAGMPTAPGDRVNTLPPLYHPELFVKR